MRTLALSLAILALTAAGPALAQNHDAHAGHDHHAGHKMKPPADPSPGPTMELPPPEEAGSGPPRAADAIWGAEAMRPAREALKREHGDMPVTWIQADRLEYQARAGHDGLLWDLRGYYGTPTSKFWFKSEGEAALGEGVEDAEVQALWSKAVAPYWDLQVGVRQDLAGETDTHAVIGIQGLAPYMFEIDAALFLSQRGDLTARIEAELDQRITQKLILQPRVELSLAAQDNAARKVGAGIDKIEAGLRLRYEIVPEFAPYIGLEQGWKLGGSARYARLAGEDPSVTSLVMGVRFWF
ncbi:copper resistance protein B [Novosphingobium sp.]|uniref:copper resistance protein B n=1 Tax=Novosphingobium sp. TaxID=1874826 RepID=UPI0022CB5B45|nr:copper resistance protein B [Novosphingobium sp.]MCZ8019355.1 copper resistance protein B [Novosphingobium sp.]MCZ8035170.1 copper resistance protein B [Novosphingobium sp.]MCZ8050484.1 copper resistance protein B [Novosphingobium sp.]MCZ8058830.1 copper resistance protein B [Novosphingobium sp.]MCZ8232275.1 copper resistance protein B [Novosphingobium sp.]